MEWSDALPGSGVELFLWGARPGWVLAESRFWFTRRGETDLISVGRDGMRRIVRSGLLRPVIPESVWEEGKTRMRAEFGDPLPADRLDAMLAVPDDGRAYPIRQLEVDSEGRLWVRLAQPDPLGQPNPWRVFAPDGSWLTDVQFPTGLQVLGIEAHRIFGFLLDELDLQTVVVAPIQR